MQQDIIRDYTHFYNNPSLWGKDSHPVVHQRADAVIQMIPDDVKSILDVGCGDGLILHKLGAHYFSAGADISLEALKHIKSSRVCASTTALPFKDGSFDVVLASEMIEHLPVPHFESSLNEMRKLAKKYILISVPYDEFLNLGYARCPQCGCIFHGARHVRKFTDKDFGSLFPGFAVKKIRKIGEEPEKATRLEIFLRQNLGNDYYYVSETTVCPLCQTVVKTRARRGFFSYAAAFLRRIYGAVCRGKPKWIAVLYEKMP